MAVGVVSEVGGDNGGGILDGREGGGPVVVESGGKGVR